MNKLLKISISCCATLLLAGCVGSIAPRVWFEGATDWPSVDRFTVEINGKHGTVETAMRVICTDPSTVWIYLYARKHGAQLASLPMSYSTKNVYIEKENGQRINASPTIYENVSPVDGMPSSQCTGTDPLPGNAGKQDLVQAIIRFDTAPPVSGSRWTLHLGQINVGDTTIAVPEQTLILRGREYYMQLVQ